MKIVIESIPSKEQRYDTLGDWWVDPDGTIQIRVSNDAQELPTTDHEFLVALHELVEMKVCEARGITQAQVDEFDLGMEEYCKETGVEPGDMPDAPYRREHRFAMIVEHLVAHEMGIQGYGEIR